MESNREIVLNLPQLLLTHATQRTKVVEAGRGMGKSTAIAWEIKQVVRQMPRCTGIIVGETYQQLLTRTLPSTIAGLEKLGIYKDLHYFVGRRAERKWKWPEAYEPPLKYDHAIHFITGATFHLVSQDRVGDGRGINSSYVMGDEAAKLDIEQLNTDVLATNRATRREFEKSNYMNGVLFASSTPLTDAGRWMFKLEEDAKRNPLETFYLRASGLENKDNLPDTYFRDLKRSMHEWLYNAEVLNIRVNKVEGCFYGSLNPKVHYYTNYNYGYYDDLEYQVKEEEINCLGDGDLDLQEPLQISVDWGASINSMAIGQSKGKDFHFLKNLYVKSPKILHDLMDEFVRYYAPHQNKEVNFNYDRNGNSRKDNSHFTNFEQAERILTAAGWKVNQIYQGQDPRHAAKHMLWSILLKEKDARMPCIRFNKANCSYLIISMENAPIDKDGISKGKRSERSKSLPQEEATHLSDAADILIWNLFSHYLDGTDYNSGGGAVML